ncbi:FixH family protein [Chitinimonas sp. PSY-7]|uniref:FixH family protein n=1 Tax=Chitinimonas sp. PSY-7 TaxID=3459088 RepID=UPI00403FCD67
MSESSHWYRQPVVLLFLSLLLVTVVACIGLMFVAVKTDDGLVTDDYYKQGNEIGMEMSRDTEAAKLGLSAQLFLAQDGLSLRALMIPLPDKSQPVTLRLSHPTRAGMDKVFELKPEEGGMLVVQLEKPLPTQRWLVQLEENAHDGKSDWRLRTEAMLAPGESITLRPQTP